jgi:hypothetical protein
MPAVRPSAEDDDGGSGAQFASQLNGATAGIADADAWRPAGPARTQQNQGENAGETANLTIGNQPLAILGGAGFTLPRPLPPVLPAASKLAVPNHGATQKTPRRPAASNESTLTAAGAVAPAPAPVPAPEITATLSAAAGDSTDTEDPDISVKAAGPRAAPTEAAEPAAPTVMAADGPPQSAQEMAFAARVQPTQSVDHSALPAEMASAAAVASANKKVVAAAEDENASTADTQGMLAAATTATERGAGPGATASPAPAYAAPRTEAPTPPADNPPKASAPLKDISMQVTQAGKERVDVRVVQQGGEVRVSVHSADAGLTSGLRQGLSDLQGRLEESGYRSEMWRPGASTAPLTATPSAQASTNQSRGGDGQPQQGGSQQESGRRNQNQSNQPRWVEELESSFGGEKSTGGFYGFGS